MDKSVSQNHSWIAPLLSETWFVPTVWITQSNKSQVFTVPGVIDVSKNWQIYLIDTDRLSKMDWLKLSGYFYIIRFKWF